METPTWISSIATVISAIAAIISLPISIWAIRSSKRNEKQIKIIDQRVGITMNGNIHQGSGKMVHIENKK